MVMLTT